MKACNQCGKCCINYGAGGLSATKDEIELWEVFKPHIYKFVQNGKIWVNPQTGEPFLRCPWLTKLPNEEKYGCEIYDDRPEDCRFYPVSISEMIEDECEMLEEADLVRPKQAQKKLDAIMVDSRPPLTRD